MLHLLSRSLVLRLLVLLLGMPHGPMICVTGAAITIAPVVVPALVLLTGTLAALRGHVQVLTMDALVHLVVAAWMTGTGAARTIASDRPVAAVVTVLAESQFLRRNGSSMTTHCPMAISRCTAAPYSLAV